MNTSTDSPARPKRRFSVLSMVVAAGLALAVAVGGYVGVARATNSPTFCGSACHEMGPYHTAWSQGGHKGIACVECHVDPGPMAEFQHKFVALGQVVNHIKGGTQFPLAKAPEVPNSRCIRCHAKINVAITGFSHGDHAKRGPCIKCHADAGHNVTTASLQQAGILNVAYRHTVEPTTTATPGGGKADIPNHLTVGCSNCHDMAAMKCADCHTPGPKHENRPTDCTICHSAGAKFVFTHPALPDCTQCHTPPPNLKPAHPTNTNCTLCHLSGAGVDWKFTHPQIDTCGDCHVRPASHKFPATTCTTCHKAGPGKSFAFTHPDRTDCETCHARPANHRSGPCTQCHHNPGVAWTFSHPSQGANCETCHTRPANHHSGDCNTCHKNPGKAWTFSHPSQGANCASCHNRPSGHRAGDCNTCHKNPGKSWAFKHPAPGASCANCHNRPSNHSSGSCQNCHRNAGKSWAFTHPGQSANCASCHSAPSNHYGTNCSSCHYAGSTWTNTHFAHPKMPRGPHTYKTWPCAKCHPSGPPAYFCTCHGNTTGPTD